MTALFPKAVPGTRAVTRRSIVMDTRDSTPTLGRLTQADLAEVVAA